MYVCMYVCNRAKFGHSRSNTTSVMEIRWKNWTPRVRPFNVTQGYWNRSESIGHHAPMTSD